MPQERDGDYPLSRQAQNELEVSASLAFDLPATVKVERPPLSADSLLAAIVESSDDAIISKSVDGIVTSWNKSAERLFGYSASEAIGRHITIIIPNELRHEEDIIIAHIESGERIEHYETIRRHKDGTLVDISLTVSPVRDRHGTVIGASKIVRDISERKRMTERQALLLQEMSHRVKNLFAVMSSLISLSERGAVTVHDLAEDLRTRIRALAAAHNLTLKGREEISGQDNSFSLLTLVQVIFAAHQDRDNNRVTVKGTDVALETSSLTSLALLLHEFATNAIKYGALSAEDGRVEIDIAAGDELVLKWVETGGPPIDRPADTSGFGSTLERVTIETLNGVVTRSWRPHGLCITLSIPRKPLEE